MSGIFNWAYRGWQSLASVGFVDPPSSQQVLAEAEHVLSPIAAFLDECCELDSSHQVATDDLWSA